ncbi:MAG: ribonuclease D [Planctomycetota bacterium]
MDFEFPPPILVEDSQNFARLLSDLDRADEIAVDTEGDSFFSYPEKVCLIQITALERDWLVDPLAGFDISGLGRALADPAKLKVFHDGEYDVVSLKRDHGFQFRHLFDTRVAAAALGTANPGLASVLEDRFQIKLDKSLQRSEWSRRPLTAKQIRYAQLDTHFLVQLMRKQNEELVAQRRLMIVEGECRRLERPEPPDASFDPDEFVRIKGARDLHPVERRILRELYVLREKLALEFGRPPFKVMGNDSLVALAIEKPKTMFQLGRIDGISHGQARRLGAEILAAIERATELGPMAKLPRLPSRDGTSGFTEQEGELHERLKNWRKGAAAQMGIDSAYLVNRHVLLRIASQRPRTTEALARIEGIEPWQVETFGRAILGAVEAFEGDLAAGRIQFRRRPKGNRVD